MIYSVTSQHDVSSWPDRVDWYRSLGFWGLSLHSMSPMEAHRNDAIERESCCAPAFLFRGAFVSHRRMRQEPGQQGPGEQPEVTAKEALSTRGEEAYFSHFLF